MTPQQLYELWERQQWQSHTIDLTQAKVDFVTLGYAILDYSMEDTNTFAFNALNRRLKVIGVDMASLAAAAA
jgi:hypothetical protein